LARDCDLCLRAARGARGALYVREVGAWRVIIRLATLERAGSIARRSAYLRIPF